MNSELNNPLKSYTEIYKPTFVISKKTHRKLSLRSRGKLPLLVLSNRVAASYGVVMHQPRNNVFLVVNKMNSTSEMWKHLCCFLEVGNCYQRLPKSDTAKISLEEARV